MQWVIVDPDRAARARLAQLLRDEGIDVVEVDDAVAALARFEWPVEVVATTLALPDGAAAGLALLDLASALEPSAARILLIDQPSPEADHAVLDGRASWVLYRPIDPSDVAILLDWARARALLGGPVSESARHRHHLPDLAS